MTAHDNPAYDNPGAEFCCACNEDTTTGTDGSCEACGEPRIGGPGYGPTASYLVNGTRFIRLPDDLDEWIAVRRSDLDVWKANAR